MPLGWDTVVGVGLGVSVGVGVGVCVGVGVGVSVGVGVGVSVGVGVFVGVGDGGLRVKIGAKIPDDPSALAAVWKTLVKKPKERSEIKK